MKQRFESMKGNRRNTRGTDVGDLALHRTMASSAQWKGEKKGYTWTLLGGQGTCTQLLSASIFILKIIS
jgi:hypothetical protein